MIHQSDLERCKVTAAALLSDGRRHDIDDLLDAGDETTDDDIIDAMLDTFGMSRPEAIDRLAKFDFAAARAGL